MLARSILRTAASAKNTVLPGAIASQAFGGVSHFSSAPTMHGTTILCVRKDGKVCLIGDGQVSLGHTVVKPNAKKVRRINENIVAGFAGSTADAFTLMERLESKLEEYPGQLTRACVELAKAWRTDKYLRHLEAILIVSDDKQSYTLTGNGDVVEPHDGIIGIGSGGTYALAAARALIDQPHLDAEQIGRKAMQIAADICVYTNHNFVVETLEENPEKKA
ncbi:hypothetical protein Poli38472_009066 [Pythium oligandrum]|uniref:ATP-dependent protease subunit HslV n=1 Tax=Pythium oligandrum TaxID=41045 RepID=A0A8K1CJW0_PYTOL|nr:hypothetical protein Poli38472_009066 [Pythium oligandrum]|eukprot:TMW64899.1 hypothetical protein Poli38472_009066 [Pythium oligandrum]